MNINYRIIWNATIGKWVVASELAKGRKKASRNVLAGALAVALAASAPFGAAFAADATTTGDTCTTSDGQPGSLDMGGVCSAADTASYSPANNSRSMGILGTSPIATSLAGGSSVDNEDLAIGQGAVTTALGAIAINGQGGYPSTASGEYSIVIGPAATSSGAEAIAIGNRANAVGSGGVALGSLANAMSTNSVAVGASATADVESVAIGGGSSASSTGGISSVAIGNNAKSTYQTGVAIGDTAVANNGGIAIGASATTGNAGVDAIALGQLASTSATNAVALGTKAVADRANTVSLGSDVAGSAFTKQIVNMGAGTQANDAVNVSQLSPVVSALGGGASINTTTGAVTGPTYTLANGGTQTSIGGALGALDSSLSTTNTNVSANTTNITAVQNALNSGTIGLVQQAAAGANLTVGANADGAAVNFTGTAGTRVLTGVTAGNVAAGSTDAVNGAQLFATNTQVTQNTSNIANLQEQIGDGTVGLVQQDASTGNITVAAATGGSTVDMSGTAGARVVTGVADGSVAAGSVDAVNGSQLNATNTQVAQNTSDISTLNTNVSSLNTSVTNLDGRVTTNEGNINTLQQQLSDGTVGLVQQNPTTANITVAAATGGSTVDFTGTSGARVLTGLANGVNNTDAVTIAQLKALGVDPEGQLLGALHYDDLTLATATLGGTNGTIINNLAPGLIASGSMQAVNGGQLFDFQQNVQNQFSLLTGQYNSLNDRVGTIEQSIADGEIGGPVPSPGPGTDSTQVGTGANASGANSTAVGTNSVASGDNSTATGAGSQATGSNSTANGAGAVASGSNSTATGANSIASGANSTANGYKASATGDNSTALGANSSATGNNSVALGAGSVADRDNTVSVGSPGNERQITNVAAGTQRTDAANWGQVQDAVNGVQDWASQKFQQVDKRIDRMGAMSAAYGQMAFSANGLDTKNRLGVGIGAQGGQSALAVGYSRQIKPNMNLSFGGSASAGDVSVGAGLAVGW